MTASVPFIVRRLRDCPAWRIAPADTNYFALVFDDHADRAGLVAVVEIFEPGGRTPPNRHRLAQEFFFVLQGHGRAHVAGEWADIAAGDALLVRPGHEHLVENTGADKLYCLTLLVPDEHFAALIRAGTPVLLDDADRQVLGG